MSKPILAITLFLYACYLITFSGRFHVMDELAVFSAGNNLAQHGRADINPLLWTQHWTPNPPGVWGHDDQLYTKKAPGISLLTGPLIWLGHQLPALNAVHVGLLTNMLVTALTGGLLFGWLHALGYTQNGALLTALAYGLGTMAWVYSRMFWESSILALCFLGLMWLVWRWEQGSTAEAQKSQKKFFLSPPSTTLLAMGLVAGISLTLRFEAAIAIGWVGLYLLWRLGWQQAERLMLYLAPIIITALGLLWFNAERFGGLVETGYTQEILFRAPWVGGFGLLFSPGRGLFIYAPMVWLIFFGFYGPFQRLPRKYFALIGVIVSSYWLFYGAWFAWGGTWGWGPRFLLPILPLLMLFTAEPLNQLATRPLTLKQPTNILRLIAISGLAVISLSINFLGLMVDFNEHFRQLNRNDNFVFNWADFPPLAHWRILQTGLTDIIWLHADWSVDWTILSPMLVLVGVTGGYLGYQILRPVRFSKPDRSGWLLIPLTVGLTYLALANTASTEPPAFLSELQQATASDAVWVTQPPFGDVQEMTSLLMGRFDQPVPIYQWIETPPKAITEEERARVWRGTTASAERIWLFERWLTQDEALRPTYRRLTEESFLVQATWYEQNGRLSLFQLADALSTVPSGTQFMGGLTLVEFATQDQVSAGQTLPVRLTWQAPSAEELVGLPNHPLTVFIQLLNLDGILLAQQDRLLLDLQQFEQSPLLPGQTISQGYALHVPANTLPSDAVLIIGLYDGMSGLRLFVENSGDDFIYLKNVLIQ